MTSRTPPPSGDPKGSHTGFTPGPSRGQEEVQRTRCRAELPPDVSNALSAVKNSEIELKNSVRRMRTKMRINTGALVAQEVPPPSFMPTSKGRCKSCMPCKLKACGLCVECLATPRKTCLRNRWCVTWPPKGYTAALSRCSVTSAATPESIRVAVDKINVGEEKLSREHAALEVILLSCDPVKWHGHGYLEKEARDKSLDDMVDLAEVARDEARRFLELEDRLSDFEESRDIPEQRANDLENLVPSQGSTSGAEVSAGASLPASGDEVQASAPVQFARPTEIVRGERLSAAVSEVYMKRTKLDRKSRDLELDVEVFKAQCEDGQDVMMWGLKIAAIERDYDALWRRLEEVGELYEELFHLVGSREEQDQMLGFREITHNRVGSVLREARRRARLSSSLVQGVTRAPVQEEIGHLARSHVEKVAIPQFSGRRNEYFEFKRVFRELTAGEGYRPAVLMAQLRGHIPKEACRLIEGHTEADLAWAELDAEYGNRELAILTAVHQLVEIQLTGEDHERVRAMQAAVRTCRTNLRSVDAEQFMFSDPTTVGTLVGKLPKVAQARWDEVAPAPFEEVDSSVTGKKFSSWLDEEGRRAMSAKNRQAASELKRGGKFTPTRPQSSGGGATTTVLATDAFTAKVDGPGSSGVHVGATWKQRLATRNAAEEFKKEREKSSSVCPSCKTRHQYNRKFEWGSMMWPSVRFDSCSKFNALDPAGRVKVLEGAAGCVKCLSWEHNVRKCQLYKEVKCPVVTSGGGRCGLSHHSLIHGSGVPYASTGSTHVGVGQDYEESGDVMAVSQERLEGQEAAPQGPSVLKGTLSAIFEFVPAPVQNPHSGQESYAIVFVDPGSNVNFIKTDLAEQLGLEGVQTTIHLRVIDSDYQEKSVLVYQAGVRDRAGKLHIMSCIGVASITRSTVTFDAMEARKKFPHAMEEAVNRVEGEAGMLVSMTERHLHAHGGTRVGGMFLQETLLGCGQVITGVADHPSSTSGEVSRECQSLQSAVPRLPAQASTFFLSSQPPPLSDAYDREDSAFPPPECSKCTNCRECEKRRLMPQGEKEVLAQIEKDLHLENGCLVASYPWKDSVRRMRDNRTQAQAIQSKVEERSVRFGYHQDMTQAVEEMIEGGALREITEEEAEAYTGPSNYISIFPIFKVGSQSTKIRMVSNSAMINQRSGLSLNQVIAKGPDLSNSLASVIVHWRFSQHVVLFDLTKAYWQVQTGERELHMRRVRWRSSLDQQWRTYGFTCATFGDIVAGVLLEMGRRMGARMIREELEAGADKDQVLQEEDSLLLDLTHQVDNYVYVDDGAVGGESRQVDHILGRGDFSSQGSGLQKILQSVGLKTKFMIPSQDPDAEHHQKLGTHVLGLPYELASDRIQMKIDMKISVKESRGRKTEVALHSGVIDAIEVGKERWTRRRALSLVMGMFDPLGFICPILVTGKLLLRRLSQITGLGWDEDLPEEERRRWVNWLRALASDGVLSLPRTVSPCGMSGDFWLVGFSDASLDAVCAVVYIVWFLGGGPQQVGSSSRVICAKSRLTPAAGTTVPRAELHAFCVLMRLLVSITKDLHRRPQSVVTTVDSRCVQATVARAGSKMKPYFANRVAEVTQLKGELQGLAENVEEISWVEGKQNPADLGTRPGVTVMELSKSSLWTEGPQYLRSGRCSWPVSMKVDQSSVPQGELRPDPMCGQSFLAFTHSAAENGMIKEASPEDLLSAGIQKIVGRARSMKTAAGTLARAIKRILTRSTSEPEPEERERAERLLLWGCSGSAREALEAGELTSLGARMQGMQVVVDGRVSKDVLAVLLGIEYLPVVMPSEQLAYLILLQAHAEDHRRNHQDSLARSRRVAWIPRGGAVAKKVIRDCMTCRMQNKKLSTQLMAKLPKEKLLRSAPFTHVSMDQFGPAVVKDTAKGRRRFSCWGTIFTCLSTKAVAILATPGCSAEVFINTFKKFASTYGVPEQVFSDHAPQAVRAVGSEDWTSVWEFMRAGSIKWTWTPKGCSWRNGSAERAIKSARHTLHHVLLKGELLDYDQFDAVLHQVAAILNSRPITVRVHSDLEYVSITPNDILLGRASRGTRQSHDHSEEADVSIKRVHDKQSQIVNEWWERWTSRSWALLTPRTKWLQEERQLAVGDICHLHYSQKFGPPSYRLCRVTEVLPGEDGMVRTVRVYIGNAESVRCSQEESTKNITVGIHRLAVLLPVEDQHSFSPQEDSELSHPEIYQQQRPTTEYVASKGPATVASKESELMIPETVQQQVSKPRSTAQTVQRVLKKGSQRSIHDTPTKRGRTRQQSRLNQQEQLMDNRERRASGVPNEV